MRLKTIIINRVIRIVKNFFLIFFCTTISVSYGQANKTKKILLDSTSFTNKTRIIVLIETDTFLVFTTYNLFIDNCKKYIKEHNIKGDKVLLKRFKADKSKIIYADSLTKNDMNKSRLLFRKADLFDSGQCLVYNKKIKSLEKFIELEIYYTPFVSGRRIIISNKYLILETVDGVY